MSPIPPEMLQQLQQAIQQRQGAGMAQPPPDAVPAGPPPTMGPPPGMGPQMGPPPGAMPQGPVPQGGPPPTGMAAPESAPPNPQGGNTPPGVTTGQGGQMLYNGTPVSFETLNYLRTHGGT